MANPLGILGGVSLMMLYGRPSLHFSWAELTTTSTGLDNTPDTVSDRLRLILLCWALLEPIRAKFGAININSSYRSTEVNDAVGGVKTSYHKRGLAADIWADNAGPETIAAWLHGSSLPVAECIVYHPGPTWSERVHVALDSDHMTDPARKFLQTWDSGKTYSAWTP